MRRHWKCPKCNRVMKRQGDIVGQLCGCEDPPVRMKLLEQQRNPRPYQPYLVPELDADALIGEEVDAPGKESVTPPETASQETVSQTENPAPATDNDPPPESQVTTADAPAISPAEAAPGSEAESSVSEEEADASPTAESTEEKPEKKGRRGRRRNRKRSRKRRSQDGGNSGGDPN